MSVVPNSADFQFQTVIERLDRLESLLDSLVRQQGRKPDPAFLSWDHAARLLGLNGAHPARAAKARVERERQRPNGLRIRVRRGGVNRADFIQFLEKIQGKPSAGARVACAVDRLMAGGAR